MTTNNNAPGIEAGTGELCPEKENALPPARDKACNVNTVLGLVATAPGRS